MAVQVSGGAMRRLNVRVPDLMFASDVDISGQCTVDIPAVPTASNTAIINGVVLAAAGNAAPNVVGFNPAAVMGRYGRNVVFSLGAAGTPTVTVVGFDYLGQSMRENIVAAGATPVVGVKMFYDIAYVIMPAAGTVNLGTGVVLGVPYKVLSTGLLGELMNDTMPTAGALAAGVVTQTLTSGDPRGRYTPNAVPNGANAYRFTCIVDRNNLHGSAHVVA